MTDTVGKQVDSAQFVLLEEQLGKNLIWITFTKIDGSIREMLCTRDQKRIPKSGTPKGTNNKHDAQGLLKVYDIESGGWRSMRKANIVAWSKKD